MYLTSTRCKLGTWEGVSQWVGPALSAKSINDQLTYKPIRGVIQFLWTNVFLIGGLHKCCILLFLLLTTCVYMLVLEHEMYLFSFNTLCFYLVRPFKPPSTNVFRCFIEPEYEHSLRRTGWSQECIHAWLHNQIEIDSGTSAWYYIKYVLSLNKVKTNTTYTIFDLTNTYTNYDETHLTCLA